MYLLLVSSYISKKVKLIIIFAIFFEKNYIKIEIKYLYSVDYCDITPKQTDFEMQFFEIEKKIFFFLKKLIINKMSKMSKNWHFSHFITNKIELQI